MALWCNNDGNLFRSMILLMVLVCLYFVVWSRFKPWCFSGVRYCIFNPLFRIFNIFLKKLKKLLIFFLNFKKSLSNIIFHPTKKSLTWMENNITTAQDNISMLMNTKIISTPLHSYFEIEAIINFAQFSLNFYSIIE